MFLLHTKITNKNIVHDTVKPDFILCNIDTVDRLPKYSCYYNAV